MSETMADFSSALDNSMRVINAGDLVHGSVVGISDTEVTVDLQYFAEGIIRAADYSGDPSFSIKQNVEIGEEVDRIRRVGRRFEIDGIPAVGERQRLRDVPRMRNDCHRERKGKEGLPFAICEQLWQL